MYRNVCVIFFRKKLRNNTHLLKLVSTTERNRIWGRVMSIFIFGIYIFLSLELFMHVHYFIEIKLSPKELLKY